MSGIVSYVELRTLAQNKWVKPVPDAHVNPASIDVTLGTKLLVEYRDPELTDEDEFTVLSLKKREPMLTVEHDLTAEPFILWPGTFVLAHTAELFDLPLDVSAEFRLKSSAARMGLSHALAVWCDPGWHGSSLTLELHNISTAHAIRLEAGDRIGQMIFHRHAPVPKERSYAATGAYNQDAEVSGAKPARS